MGISKRQLCVCVYVYARQTRRYVSDLALAMHVRGTGPYLGLQFQTHLRHSETTYTSRLPCTVCSLCAPSTPNELGAGRVRS